MKFIKLGGYHGRTFGALALTHFKYIMKVDIPSLPWPIAPFPQYLYPLDQYEKENKEEDARCIEQVNLIFIKFKLILLLKIDKIYIKI